MNPNTPALTLEANMLATEVREELMRAIVLHPSGMHSPHEAYAVILEELDEYWELVKINPKKLSFDDQDSRLSDMRKELVQVAAMALRAVIETLPTIVQGNCVR